MSPLYAIGILLLTADMAQSQQCPAPTAAQATADIRTLNQQYIDAARTNDAAWFGRHMSPDVVVILGNGRRVRKDEFLALMRDEPKRYRSLAVRDATVRVFGTAAQVDADAPWELGDGSSGVSRYIDTYAWIDCRWQVVSAQITWLPKTS